MSKSTLLALSVMALGTACSSDSHDADRWATTENTNVKIDWDKINEAYKTAEGPDDLEKKVNEIYEGDEIISVQVKDEGKSVQTVTGFFDKDQNGKVDEGEKIFTIKRNLDGEGETAKASYQTVGYGPHYGYYYSPTYSLVTGMVMGSMLSSMYRPHYMPMYTTAYVTSTTRYSTLSSNRSTYRTSNPARFSRGTSSGRSYGTTRSSGGSTRSSSGGGFRSRGGGFGVKLTGSKTRLTA